MFVWTFSWCIGMIMMDLMVKSHAFCVRSVRYFSVNEKLLGKTAVYSNSKRFPSIFHNFKKSGIQNKNYSTGKNPEKTFLSTGTLFGNESSQDSQNELRSDLKVYNKTVRQTGSFAHNWPTVHEAIVHYKRAYRATEKAVVVDPKIKNERNQYRKYAAQFIDTLMKQLSVPITQYLDLYTKGFQDLHPYEATVANLTIVARAKKGFPELIDVMQRLKQLRAQTSRTAKDFAKQCKEASSVASLKEILENATVALETLYNEQNEYTQSLADLIEIHKELRRIPIIQLTLPTIALVGAPNVGKSSIVRAISSGLPEVNNYPFTTRGVTIGHIEYSHPKTKQSHTFQVMDTPGLLDRPEIERNEMERLTFASLLHLPTAVLYVIDHTNQAGEKSTLPTQLKIRETLKQRFPRRPWLDVISKGDLLPFSQEARTLFESYGLQPSEKIEDVLAAPASTPLIISVISQQNIPILQEKVIDILLQLKEMLLANPSLNSSSTSTQSK